jgi:tRNA threonylcarbamoyladenosine biosynthesis protein TsaE
MGKTIIETNSQQETREAGFKMGRDAVPGQIICLTGDLGVGKTVFTQGFAEGLGISEPICSPTFTIIQEYTDGRLPLYHFDVYRLGSVEEMDEIGYEEYFYGDGVCLVEWGNLFPELFSDDTIFVTIEKDLEKGLDYRKICIINGDRNENFSN